MKRGLFNRYLLFVTLPVMLSCCLLYVASNAQTSAPGILLIKELQATPVKDQANTGTCWSFSMTSLIESESLKNGRGTFDLSEMFTVRNIYKEKAVNYILRQGNAQFSPGGLGYDVIHAMEKYGAVPESIYSGLVIGQRTHDHSRMDRRLKVYLDSVLTTRPLPNHWMRGFESILDEYLGTPPERFLYNEKMYTPLSFAREVLHFSADDYVSLTSFSHHPFYSSFILEAPDNALNSSYYNIPLQELIALTKSSIEAGYSLMWDADVSNTYFRHHEGLAMMPKNEKASFKNPDEIEITCSQQYRQSLYENLTTMDDHLMHIVGIEKSKGGKIFFLVKNSWGEDNPYKGFIHVSETYYATNTVSIVIPKAALDPTLKAKLKLN